MAIDKIFDGAVDGIADNLFNSVSNSVSEIKAMQQRKAAENVQLVVQALKKIDADIREKYDGVTETIEKRVANIKDGRDGIDGKNGLDGVNGKDGRDGKDGRNGRDGLTGPRGFDGPKGADGKDGQNGEDGVSVTDAHIDFDGSLIISLSSGRVINVGEVVAADIAEKIKVITNGGGTSQPVLDQLASLQAQIDLISSALVYKGTWNASTNTPTLTSSAGTANTFYIVSVAGTTTLNGTSNWGVGDWAVYNGSVWQRIEGGAVGNFTDLSVSGTTTLSGLTASTALALNASKQVVSVTNTGSGNNVLATSPTLVTPVLGTPSSVTLTNATGLPLSTGVTGTLPIANGGTGQTTATNAFTALAPSQTGNSGKYLTTNGTSASWATVASGTVTSVSGTGTVNGLTLTGTVTTSGSLTLGGTLSGISNASLTNSSITINGTATSLGGSISVGTVTSVAATVPSFLSITGSPITSSGTLAISLSGTALPTTSGGTGLTSFTANGVVYASSSSALTTGSALTFDGSKLVNTGYNKSTYQVSTNTVGTFESVGAAYLTYDSATGSSIYSRSNATAENILNFRASTFSFKIGGTQVSSLDSSSFSLYNTPILLSGSTSGYTGFAAPATSNYTIYTLPSADGTSGQSLVTNGSGTLSWASGTGGTVTSVSGTGTVSGISLSGTVTSSGSLTLGGSLDLSAYNGAGAFTTLSASSTVTLSGGTANGVAYLNGSKVVTSGSALTFDGTNFGLNATPTNYGAGYRTFAVNGSSSGAIEIQSAGTVNGLLVADNSDFQIQAIGAKPIRFFTNGNQRATIDSSGNLGIGTSSPAYKLDVSSSAEIVSRFARSGGSNALVMISDPTSVNAPYIGSYGNALAFGSFGVTEYGRFTSTGLGIGTSSPAVKLHVSGQSRVADSSNAANYMTFGVGANAPYGNASISTTTAGLAIVAEGAGNMTFFNNGSERMRIDSSGNLGLGVAPSAWTTFKVMQLGNFGAIGGVDSTSMNMFANTFYDGAFKYINTSSASRYRMDDGHSWFTAPSGTAGNAITFTQAMTLDASGNLGVGETSPTSRLHVSFTSNSVDNVLQIQQKGNNTASGITLTANDNNGAGYNFIQSTTTGGTTHWRITGGVATSTLAFSTGGSERMRIDSSGNVGIGTSSPGKKLDVVGTIRSTTSSASLELVSSTAGGSSISFLNSSTYEAYISSLSGGGILFGTGTAATERARISSTGILSVGYTGNWNDTAAYLHVLSGIVIGSSASPALFTSIKSSNGYDLTLTANANPANIGVNANIIFSSGNSGGGGPSELGRFTSAGNFGINTSSPGQRLDVNGNIRSRDGAIVLSIGTAQQAVFCTYNQIFGSGTDYTPTIFAETGLGLTFAVNGSATKAMSLTSGGNLLVGTTSTTGGFPLRAKGGGVDGSTTVTVPSGVTTTIYTIPNTATACMCVVFGDNGSSGFCDLLFFLANTTPQVVSSKTMYGSPPARTYSAASSTQLQINVAMDSSTRTAVLGTIG